MEESARRRNLRSLERAPGPIVCALLVREKQTHRLQRDGVCTFSTFSTKVRDKLLQVLAELGKQELTEIRDPLVSGGKSFLSPRMELKYNHNE